MKDRRFRTTVLFLLGLLLILVLTILFFYSQGNENKNNHTDLENIEYGEVYTFPVRDDSPAYIKFLDETHYVAISNIKSPEDSFGDGESYSINFIEGEYQNVNDSYSLGKKVRTIAIFFDGEEELNKKEYNRFYKRDTAGKNTFETGDIVEKDGKWLYERTVNNQLVDYPLKKTSETLQDSIEDFLIGYKLIENEE